MVIAISVLLFAIALGAAGQILLKYGISQLGEKPAPTRVLASIVTNSWVFLGFFCYAASSLFYIVALSRLELSYAYPMIALSYVVVTFLAWKLLHEQVPGLRVVGLAVILVGVVVMAASYRGPVPTPNTHAKAAQVRPN
jgi:drug/metabolite transporter (DMT)-like permease